MANSIVELQFTTMGDYKAVICDANPIHSWQR
jgi:hypothetical protein